MITVADAQKVITRKKHLVAPMGWAKKLNHTEPVWYEYRSALEFEDDPTEPYAPVAVPMPSAARTIPHAALRWR